MPSRISSVAIFVLAFISLSAQSMKSYSYADALSIAQAENKDILVIFSEPWCGPCQRMKKTLFVLPEILSQISKDYVFVKSGIDIPTDWSRQYSVNTLPHSLIIDPYGGLRARLEGGASKSEFQQFLSCQCTIQKSFVSPDGEDSFVTFASMMNQPEEVIQERYWSVQAGKYHGPKWALVLKEKLENHYQDVHMTYDVSTEGKQVYRVFVGKYGDAISAISARDRLRADGVKCHVKHL